MLVKIFIMVSIVLLVLPVLLELALRWYVESPLRTDFYSSINEEDVLDRQAYWGIKVASGPNWAHLGWIADPEWETYRIEWMDGSGRWTEVGRAEYGSFLIGPGGTGRYRVIALVKDGTKHAVGEAVVQVVQKDVPVLLPKLVGDWQVLFKPARAGTYVNDHTIFRDGSGNWRLVGITSASDGDYNQEKWFAQGVSEEFPPAEPMREVERVADFGELAWAPSVLETNGKWHMFWSPHALHQMESDDGVTWRNHTVTLPAPYRKFFRDGMVYQVAADQWLLYTTARGRYHSSIDVYQSFDLKEWQFIRSAVSGGWRSERNSPFASMESPFLIAWQDRYYLSFTYNNDSGAIHGLFMPMKIWWPNRQTYNDTLVLTSKNPYDFGEYNGKANTPNLVGQITAHAPEWVDVPGKGWYITTAGWPWVTELTNGEVAVAPIDWVIVR